MQEFEVKYYPEMLLKSRSVRRYCCQRLGWNLEKLLKAVHPDCRVQREWARLWVTCPEVVKEAVWEVLSTTPGVDQFSRIERRPWNDLDELAGHALELYGEALEGRSFGVRVKREKGLPFRSGEVERFLGAKLLETGLPSKVDLTRPEVPVRIRLTAGEAWFHVDHGKGLGGFALGTQGACLSLVSGGYDSSVASFSTIRRGLVTHFLFFNLGGAAHERAVRRHAHYLWRRYGASHPVQFVSVPFEEVVGAILEKVSDGYMGVFIKRCFLKAATPIARRLKCPALVTGEAVAQVASQTLVNLQAIDTATDLLVIRPLVTMDKRVVIQQADAIGTRAFADRMPEYCAVISKSPTIAADPEKLAAEEADFPWEVLERAVEQATYTPITELGEES
ncbi:MAG: tRNA 4-thiouridine(8) synthase ThiI, partial [Gammaproteobacteria bacterium]